MFHCLFSVAVSGSEECGGCWLPGRVSESLPHVVSGGPGENLILGIGD